MKYKKKRQYSWLNLAILTPFFQNISKTDVSIIN